MLADIIIHEPQSTIDPIASDIHQPLVQYVRRTEWLSCCCGGGVEIKRKLSIDLVELLENSQLDVSGCITPRELKVKLHDSKHLSC